MLNIVDLLQERGFIEATTSEELREKANSPLKVYCGFDPSSDSLHLGNMIAIMGLAWFQRCGHTPVVILGGATGMIGDPSGKSVERQLLDQQQIDHNIQGIRKNFEALLDFSSPTNKAVLLNNYDWFKNFSFIDVLRNIGKYFRVGSMLAKDSVKARLNSEEGMSFTEFSYQLLQGYDFLHLSDNFGVNVQLGGSDQWGNITAGIELTRKVSGASVYGMTFPLLTRSDGQKFGKSEKGAIWLSAEKLSVYEFYQHIYRIADSDVIKLMRLLTFMDMEEIRGWEQRMNSAEYLPNTAQKRLAEEITRNVHGEEGLQVALKVTEGVSPGSQTVLNAQVLEEIAKDMPSCNLAQQELTNVKLPDVLWKVGLTPSKAEARRLIRNGGVYVNNEKIIDENFSVQLEHLIDGRLLLLAVGKKNKILVRIQ